jgi:hypothetical protein
MTPRIITGFRPYRSETIPQATDVKDLPSMNEDPTTFTFTFQSSSLINYKNDNVLLRNTRKRDNILPT